MAGYARFEEVNHPNRTSVKNSVRHGFYCWGCDAAIVLPDRKCPVCGKRNKSSRTVRSRVSDVRRLKEDGFLTK